MPFPEGWTIENGEVNNVRIKELKTHHDDRGSLVELWRSATMPYDLHNHPVMGYYSVTLPGIIRGPHEHKFQFDNFIFVGTFELFLWDRIDYKNIIVREKKVLASGCPALMVTIPPQIVHAYRNAGDAPGITFNFPSQYYGGITGNSRIDEIRYEKNPDSPYQIW